MPRQYHPPYFHCTRISGEEYNIHVELIMRSPSDSAHFTPPISERYPHHPVPNSHQPLLIIYIKLRNKFYAVQYLRGRDLDGLPGAFIQHKYGPDILLSHLLLQNHEELILRKKKRNKQKLS
jgi:hypothetical protein